MERFYPIGVPGQAWGEAERDQWRASQATQRSYADEVRQKIDGLDGTVEVHRYGALSVDPDRYPLFAVTSRAAGTDAPWVLVTGGVHGYETSGVQGALLFLRDNASRWVDRINLVVAPCVSPWGYEKIQRWNAQAIDPNRSFSPDSPAEESRSLMAFVAGLGVDFSVHIDLHETTDSDEGEFRPALAARDGKSFEPGHIPDGFYLVADRDDPQPAFQRALIEAVERVTHIAPADADNQIIGSDVTQPGVIRYAFAELGLCAGMTNATYRTTTEVYPDSPRATDEICNRAQVAAVEAALEFTTSQRADAG